MFSYCAPKIDTLFTIVVVSLLQFSHGYTFRMHFATFCNQTLKLYICKIITRGKLSPDYLDETHHYEISILYTWSSIIIILHFIIWIQRFTCSRSLIQCEVKFVFYFIRCFILVKLSVSSFCLPIRLFSRVESHRISILIGGYFLSNACSQASINMESDFVNSLIPVISNRNEIFVKCPVSFVNSHVIM
jgi:hypothetical protein